MKPKHAKDAGIEYERRLSMAAKGFWMPPQKLLKAPVFCIAAGNKLLFRKKSSIQHKFDG